MSEAGGFSALREALADDFFHIAKEIDHPEYPRLETTLDTLNPGHVVLVHGLGHHSEDP